MYMETIWAGKGKYCDYALSREKCCVTTCYNLQLLKDFEKINTTILSQHFKFQFDLECVSNCLGTRREPWIYHKQLSKLSTVTMHP